MISHGSAVQVTQAKGDSLLALSDDLFIVAITALVAVIGAAVWWAFAVRARREKTAAVMRRSLHVALIALTCFGLAATFLRVALGTKTYDQLPSLPDQTHPNPFGIHLTDVAVDGVPVPVGGRLVVEQRNTYLLSGRIVDPHPEDHARAGYSYFVLSTNKSVHFLRSVPGEINPTSDGTWQLRVSINIEFCYYRYPSLFSVVMAPESVAAQLRAEIGRNSRWSYLRQLDWFGVGDAYVDKKPRNPTLRTCYDDR